MEPPTAMHLRNCFLAFAIASLSAFGAAPPADLTGYRTVATAITTAITKTNAATGQSGYLGIHVAALVLVIAVVMAVA
ncbi:MAG: hypothetical protein EBT61_15610, partial [Verrucomicrobia bacterium]|nr:hypothetical protein [Verrucomicrobiota bacterium]